MDRTSNSVEYGILINQQNYDGYAIIAEIRQKVRGAIPKCGHVALVLDCCYVDVCVIFSSSGSLRMRLISQFSRASGARFSETDTEQEIRASCERLERATRGIGDPRVSFQVHF